MAKTGEFGLSFRHNLPNRVSIISHLSVFLRTFLTYYTLKSVGRKVKGIRKKAVVYKVLTYFKPSFLEM